MSDALEAYREKVGEFERARREAEKARKEAIEELLKQRREISAHLRQLGYEGDQPEGTRRKTTDIVADEPSRNGLADLFRAPVTATEVALENGHKRRRLKGGQTFHEAYCSICELKGHDLRAHRGQDHKRAFSAAELRGKGLRTE
jgi:hypothetical protein